MGQKNCRIWKETPLCPLSARSLFHSRAHTSNVKVLPVGYKCLISVQLRKGKGWSLKQQVYADSRLLLRTQMICSLRRKRLEKVQASPWEDLNRLRHKTGWEDLPTVSAVLSSFSVSVLFLGPYSLSCNLWVLFRGKMWLAGYFFFPLRVSLAESVMELAAINTCFQAFLIKLDFVSQHHIWQLYN